MPAQTNNTQNKSEAITSPSGTDSNATPASAETHRANDPFLFYSNRDNLERARTFMDVDYRNEEELLGNTVRRTRISFEKDAFSLMSEMLLENENWWGEGNIRNASRIDE